MPFDCLKKSVFLILVICVNHLFAQLSGTLTVPGTYNSLAAAITDLNTQGVNGSVTVNIAAGYTETAVTGGYSLTVTATNTNTILFQKSGSGPNPLITAYSGGTATPSSPLQDGIFRFVGCDYITIDGIDLLDTNSLAPATMEFGYGFFKSGVSDGCQFNCIKNCVITLNRNNNAPGIFPAANGSRGIDVVNAIDSQHTSSLTIVSSSGSNSNNRFYNNIIKNCNIGISLNGFADISPFNFADMNNDIGGSVTSDGNQILNYGGAISATNSACGIQSQNQWSLNVSNNLVNNNNGSGVNHSSVLKGIFLNTAQSANATINNNTVTVKGGGTTATVTAIENASGSTASSNTINITNNLITNCVYPTSTSGPLYGIYNSAAPAVLNFIGNTLLNNTSSATSGNFFGIYNTGNVTAVLSIINNLVDGFNATSNPAPFGLRAIYNIAAAPTCSVTLNTNTLQSVSYNTNSSSSEFSFLYNSSSGSSTDISNNTLNPLSLTASGNIYFIRNICNSPVVNINSNTTTGTVTTNKSAFMYGYQGSGSSSGSLTVGNNNFSNFRISATSGMIYGIQTDYESSNFSTVRSNTVSNISNNGLYVWGISNGAGGPGSSVRDNLIENIFSANGVYALSIGGNSNTSIDVYNNIVHGISALTGVVGLSVGSGSVSNYYKNKIYDLQTSSTTSSVYGIEIFGAASNTIHIFNNLVGDLRQPNANCFTCVTGIYVVNNTANTIIDLANNSVYLDAVATATSNFGSVGLYHTANGNPGSQFILRNNIIINNCTPAGTGSVVAFRRSSAVMGSYTTTSNNNIFYAGPPAANRFIYFDGTNLTSSINSFKSFVSPRESNSAAELSPFISTVGASSNYLDLSTTIPTFAESGGIPVAGVTDDFGGNLRNVVTPDIGAWEGNYTYTCNPPPPPSNMTPSVSLTVCNGANTTLSVSASGTASWYSSSTSTSVIGTGNSYTTPTLSAGTYTYFAEDFTCAQSYTRTAITVSVNATPTANAGPSQTITCITPSVSLSGSGVSSFTWTGSGIASGGNTANPVIISAGIYSLTGSSSGCVSNTSTVMVSSDTAAPNLTVTNSSPVCAGQSVTLTVSGADTYSWNTASTATSVIVSPATSVNYTVVGTNTLNGCYTVNSQFVSVNPLPTVSANTSSASVCSGSTGCLYAISGSATSYTWAGPCGFVSLNQNPCFPFTPLCACTYTVWGTDTNNCVNSATTCINVVMNPTVNIFTSDSLLCTGQTSTITANGALTYSWSTSTSGSTIAVSPTITTTYSVIGTDANGCTNSASLTQSVSACTGLAGLPTPNSEISIYPNPAAEEIILKTGQKEDLILEIFNPVGQSVLKQKIAENETKINLGELPNGIYFIKIRTETAPVYQAKIIKQ